MEEALICQNPTAVPQYINIPSPKAESHLQVSSALLHQYMQVYSFFFGRRFTLFFNCFKNPLVKYLPCVLGQCQSPAFVLDYYFVILLRTLISISLVATNWSSDFHHVNYQSNCSTSLTKRIKSLFSPFHLACLLVWPTSIPKLSSVSKSLTACGWRSLTCLLL